MMDLETAAKRAQVTATVQAAAGSLVHLRSLLYFVAKSTGQAAALRADPPPTPAEVAALLADVPAARKVLAASQAGRAAIKRADEIRAPAGSKLAPARPIVAAVENLLARWDAIPPVVKRLPASSFVVEDACRTFLAVDAVLRDLERMAAAVESADPQVLASLELLAVSPEDEPS